MEVLRDCINLVGNNKYIKALETGTIRSYNERHESTRWLGETIKEGKIISVDNNPNSITVSKDICKHLNNIEWILGDSLEVLAKQEKESFHFILLDSVNDRHHIFEEFKLALTLIKNGGIIVIDDFGVGSNHEIPDPTFPGAEKGVKVFKTLKEKNLLRHMHMHQSRKGVQALFIGVKPELKKAILG
jgi:predicted O-methyltransferase YrrM